MMVPHFFKFPGYETIDVQTSLKKQTCTIHLKRLTSKPKACHRCGTELGRSRGRHPVLLETLSVMGFRCYLKLWRGISAELRPQPVARPWACSLNASR